MGNFLLSFIFVGSLFLPSFERSYLFEAPRLCNGFLIFFQITPLYLHRTCLSQSRKGSLVGIVIGSGELYSPRSNGDRVVGFFSSWKTLERGPVPSLMEGAADAYQTHFFDSMTSFFHQVRL